MNLACSIPWCISTVPPNTTAMYCVIHKHNHMIEAPGRFGDDVEEEDEFCEFRYGKHACVTCDETGKCTHCDGDGHVYYACTCGCGDENEFECMRCDGGGDCPECDGEGHDGGYVDPKLAAYENWLDWTGQLHPLDFRTLRVGNESVWSPPKRKLNPDDYAELRLT